MYELKENAWMKNMETKQLNEKAKEIIKTLNGLALWEVRYVLQELERLATANSVIVSSPDK